MAPSSPGGRLLLPAALVLLLAGALLQILAGYSHPDLSGEAWGTDDAYISYRYAHNLAAGHGLVFNPGERVEGFSNLLYVLLLAPAEALVGPAGIYAVSTGLNLLFAAIALALLSRFAHPRLGDRPAGALALLFALCPPLWAAIASGLETPLVLLIQIATWILVERAVEEGGEQGQNRWTVLSLCILAAISVLARADGFVTPLLAAGFLVLRGRWRAAGGVALTTLAVFGTLTALRLSYYGWPLPNTYYVKVDGSLAQRFESGWVQLLSAALATGLLFYLAIFGLAAVRGLKGLSLRRLRRSDPLPGLPFPVVFAAGWLVYFVYVGGDVFYDRFLLFLFPMGTYLLLQLAEEIRRPRLVAVLLVLVLVLQLVPLGTDPRFSYRAEKYDRWVFLGRYLGEKHPGALLAVDGAGKIPYFSGLRTIDMLGLADTHIAHSRAESRGYFRVGHAKADLDYVLSRHPDLIANWLGDTWGLRQGPVPEPASMAQAGYRLIYLVNTDAEPKDRNLLDVRGASADEIRSRFAEGYRYGVFGRISGVSSAL
jgi:arabinofuranosyltransferase